VVLVTYNAERMNHGMLSPVASLAPSFFSHYFVNGAIFVKTFLNIKYVFIFSTAFI
jgi:hypothetical protein